MKKTTTAMCQKCKYSSGSGDHKVYCMYITDAHERIGCQVGYCDKFKKRKWQRRSRVEKDILEQYNSVKAEIEENRRRLQSINDKLARYDNKYTEIDSVTGGSGGTQHFKVEGFPQRDYSRLKSRWIMRKARIELLQKELEDLKDCVEEYIFSIQDSQTRRILMLRYVDKLQWKEIAKRMGEGFTPDAVRKVHDRFIAKK